MINSNELCNYSNYIELPNYIEHHPATSDKVGAPLFISKQLNYKNRNDLNLCQKNIKNTHTESTIIGCIYKHPKLSISNLSNTFL